MSEPEYIEYRFLYPVLERPRSSFTVVHEDRALFFQDAEDCVFADTQIFKIGPVKDHHQHHIMAIMINGPTFGILPLHLVVSKACVKNTLKERANCSPSQVGFSVRITLLQDLILS